jgi:hypothetical protein
MTAHATLVVADPDDFAAGTDLRNAFTGITLSVDGNASAQVQSFDGTFITGPSGGTNVASTGTRVFGHDITGSSINEQDFFRNWDAGIAGVTPRTVLRVDFDTETDFVSIDMIADDDDEFTLQAFSTDGTLLETINLGVFAMSSMTFSIDRDFADIAYVLAAGISGEGGALDNLRFNNCLPFPGGGATQGCKPPPVVGVPEPGTIGLLAIGLLGLGVARRKQTS